MNILLLVAAGMAVAEDTSSTLRPRNDSVRTGEAHSDYTDSHMECSRLLRTAGYSDSCVAAALEKCSLSQERVAAPFSEHSNYTVSHVQLSALLRTAGYSDSCVAAALENCSLAQPRAAAPFIKKVERAGEGGGRPMMWDARPRNCKDLMDYGDCWSGLRYVYPDPARPYHSVHVYCEQTLDGGGWTVIQRRMDDAVREDFFRTWIEYRFGFGQLHREFWLGLDNIHVMTSKIIQELRVDLYDWEERHRWAKYSKFFLGPESSNYRLHIESYSGTAGDSLYYHNGQSFSTHDQDNDISPENCAKTRRGAWWYRNCCYSNLNGYPHMGHFTNATNGEEGIMWYPFAGRYYSLMKTTMMIRPVF